MLGICKEHSCTSIIYNFYFLKASAGNKRLHKCFSSPLNALHSFLVHMSEFGWKVSVYSYEPVQSLEMACMFLRTGGVVIMGHFEWHVLCLGVLGWKLKMAEQSVFLLFNVRQCHNIMLQSCSKLFEQSNHGYHKYLKFTLNNDYKADVSASAFVLLQW